MVHYIITGLLLSFSFAARLCAEKINIYCQNVGSPEKSEWLPIHRSLAEELSVSYEQGVLCIYTEKYVENIQIAIWNSQNHIVYFVSTALVAEEENVFPVELGNGAYTIELVTEDEYCCGNFEIE